MKMPPEFRGHLFFNFKRIFSNHFAFIRSFADLLVNFALLLVSFTLLLVNFVLFTREFHAFYDNERANLMMG
ncbi:hypothetical protein H7T43_11535 [Peribacillus simplex]|uniref:hypothetical protein n=1 Tax=Peribacillus TaxID=2675229 RepID=UPI002161E846|nr:MULTISPECIES: hypothetical protein [Peribacillus]MBX9955542.1 hypothetical protein [Peribacillus simplex]